MPNKKIVFVTYGGGHVNMLVPVIKELQKQDNLELVVLGLTTAGSVLKNNNIPYIGFKDLLKDNDNALKWGKKLVRKNDAHNLVSYKESVAYMGLSYVDLENEYGKEMAAKLYSEKGRQVFNPMNTIRRFLEEESPDLLVATNSPRAERAAINVARELGIASVCLIDLFALQEVEWIGRSGYADQICVLSEYVKNILIKHERVASEIIVTGNPAFDSLKTYKNKSNYFRQKYGISNQSKVILWASQPEPNIHPFTGEKGVPQLPENIESHLVDIATKNPEYRIIFRLHPSEHRKYSNLPKNVYVSRPDDSLYEQLALSDVVLTMSSTVGLEAAIIGKDLITIDLSVFTKDAPYSEMGLSYGVKNLYELENLLKKKFKIETKIKNEISLNATKNVVEVLLKTVGIKK